MARRLLGPVNAASVLEAQSEDNMQNAQVNGDLSLEELFPGDYAVTYLYLHRADRGGLFGTSAGKRKEGDSSPQQSSV